MAICTDLPSGEGAIGLVTELMVHSIQKYDIFINE
jgi:hypothetical protein